MDNRFPNAVVVVEVTDGAVTRVSSNVTDLTSVDLVIVDDSTPRRSRMMLNNQLDELLAESIRQEVIVGVAMATSLAAERFLVISKMAYATPEAALTDVRSTMAELAEILESLPRQRNRP